MHEMSLAEGVLQIIEEYAAQAGASRVKTVWLEIGALAGVEAEAMRFCFDAVTRGSVADGAALEIIAVPGTAWCMQCRENVDVAARFDACPRCGGYQLQVLGGTEMRVKEFETD